MGGKKNGPHGEMKKLARQVLELKGYKSNQIYEEYVCQAEGLKKTITVDVCGIDKENSKSTVVECGITPPDRLSQLKLFFDEVIFIPFVTSIDQTQDISRYQDRINELEKQVEYLQRKVDEYKEKEEKLINACTDVLGVYKLKAVRD